MEYDSEKLSHTMPLSTAVRFSLRYLLEVIGLEDRIVLYHRLNDLIQRLAKIFGSFLGDPRQSCVILA